MPLRAPLIATLLEAEDHCLRYGRLAPRSVLNFQTRNPRLSPPGDQAEQITDAIGIAPFVVVPAEALEIFAAGDAGKCRVENRRVGIPDDIRRNQRQLHELQNTL